MNVVHLSPNLHPGGVCQMAADLAIHLQMGGVDNIVVSPPHELVGHLAAAGIKHLAGRRPNAFTLLREARRLRNILRTHGADILQVYTAEAAWTARLACRGLAPGKRPPIVGALSGYPRRGLIASGWSICDTFTVVSKHQRRLLNSAQTFFRQKTPWVIPYGICETLCHPGYRPSPDWMEQWKRTRPEAEGHYALCIPGSITPLHGLEDLVPLMKTLLQGGIPAHAYIAGDSRRADPSYLEHLRTLFAREQLDNHITWLGARPDLRDVISVCHVTLSLAHAPSTYDKAILEALALGCPVAGYDHGSVGEILSAFLPEGRVAPCDTSALADTLIQWHTYRPDTVSEIPYPYRMTDMAGNYRELYQSLLREEQTSPPQP